jgi:hypothetical protein
MALIRNELLVRRRREAAKPPAVRPRGTDTHGNQAEGRTRVLDVLLRHDLVRGSEALSREHLLEEAPHQPLHNPFHHAPFSLDVAGAASDSKATRPASAAAQKSALFVRPPAVDVHDQESSTSRLVEAVSIAPAMHGRSAHRCRGSPGGGMCRAGPLPLSRSCGSPRLGTRGRTSPHAVIRERAAADAARRDVCRADARWPTTCRWHAVPPSIHLLEVASLLYYAGAPDHLIAAGVMHDLIEDRCERAGSHDSIWDADRAPRARRQR